MNKDLKYMPIDNRATSDGTPFRNNAIKKMESSALFNHIDGHPKPKVDEFGNKIPEGFSDSRTGSMKREVGGQAKSLSTIKKQVKQNIKSAHDIAGPYISAKPKRKKEIEQGRFSTGGLRNDMTNTELRIYNRNKPGGSRKN